MASNIRTCPHCGASVSGNTTRCPNCDHRLELDLSRVPDDLQSAAETQKPEDDKPLYSSVEHPRFNLPEEPRDTDHPTPLDMLVISPRPPEHDVEDADENHVPDEIEAEVEDDEEFDAQETFVPDDVIEPPPVAIPYADTDTAQSDAAEPDSPIATREAYLSAFGDSKPIQPAARIPEPEPLPPVDTQSSTPQTSTQQVVIPAAPFTPPPQTKQMLAVQVTPQIAPYSSQPAIPYGQRPYPTPYEQQQAMPSDYWLRQRVQAYGLGGYKMEAQNQWEALLSIGKGMPTLWWIITILSGFGLIWYFMMLLFSGFKRDKVYIGLEPDGYVFEEGAGSAHIRRRRERNSRRWAVAGIIFAILSIILFFLLLVGASVVVNSYEQELAAAFPEFQLFEDVEVTEEVTAIDRENAELIGFLMIILFAMSGVGIVGGFMVAIISYIQAAAYRVHVAPLPGYD
ncbi:MAG: hypothetical protein L0154_01775 [Chloroflexi bacterium]|nr:hypothetical protein [Chloroflexota bacterium]